MAADPETFLAKLTPDVEVAVGKVRGLRAALPALLHAGWVAVRAEGKAEVVALTAAGAARRQALAAAAPARRPAKPRAAAPGEALAARLEALDAGLRARLEGLERTLSARLDGLEAAMSARNDALAAALLERGELAAAAPGPAAAPAPEIDPDAVDRAALETLAELDLRGRLGGLVPLPDLRRALAARGVADHAAVTASLERLERAWKLDLNVAQSPHAVEDRAAGIERPGRGLLYYVTRR